MNLYHNTKVVYADVAVQEKREMIRVEELYARRAIGLIDFGKRKRSHVHRVVEITHCRGDERQNGDNFYWRQIHVRIDDLDDLIETTRNKISLNRCLTAEL